MRILVWLILIYLVYRIVRGKALPELPKDTARTETFRDPICGVYISEADAVVGTMEAKRYRFCSIGCLRQFEKMQQGNN